MNNATPPRLHGRARVALISILIAALAGGTWLWRNRSQAETANQAKNKDKPPVAVGVAPVVQADLPLSLTALGTVTSNYTAVVRSRVDGQLMKVHFAEGQMVKAGQLLAEIDPRPFEALLMQAQGQLMRDEAQLKNAELDGARYRQLLAQNSIAKQQVDTQQALIDQLRGTVQLDRGNVASAKLNLDYSRITAPIAGRVGLRQVDPGNMIRSSDANGLVTITQVQPINVVFAIPETRLNDVLPAYQAGQKLTAEAWDRDNRNRLSNGMLQTLDNQLNTTTGTLNLKARFENADQKLFPNQFVHVRLTTGLLKQAVAVPSAAVQLGKPGQYVYVANSDSTVSLRTVEPGPASGELTVIRSGVKPGERVVVDGLDKLRDGARIQPVDRARQEQDAQRAGQKKPGKRAASASR